MRIYFRFVVYCGAAAAAGHCAVCTLHVCDCVYYYIKRLFVLRFAILNTCDLIGIRSQMFHIVERLNGTVCGAVRYGRANESARVNETVHVESFEIRGAAAAACAHSWNNIKSLCECNFAIIISPQTFSIYALFYISSVFDSSCVAHKAKVALIFLHTKQMPSVRACVRVISRYQRCRHSFSALRVFCSTSPSVSRHDRAIIFSHFSH